jgi:hypothetical protein
MKIIDIFELPVMAELRPYELLVYIKRECKLDCVTAHY